jgi:hypothetical protein
MSRVGTLHGDDGSFDRQFWARIAVLQPPTQSRTWPGRGPPGARLAS